MPLRLDWNVAVRYSWIKWVRWSVAAMTLFMQKAKKKFMLHCRRPNERIASVNELCCSCYVFCIHHSKCIFRSLFLSLSVTREKEKKGSEMEKMKIEELNGGYHGWWENMHCTVHTPTHVWIILSVSVWNSFITVHWLPVSTHSRELKIHSHILVRNTLMSTLRVLLFVCIIHIFFSKGSTTLRNVRATCWTSSMSL